MDNARLNWLLRLVKDGACGLGEKPTSGSDKSQSRSGAQGSITSPKAKKAKLGPFAAFAPKISAGAQAPVGGASGLQLSASQVRAQAAMNAVKKEIRNWNDLEAGKVAEHTSEDGTLDQYSLFSALHREFPIHFAAFRQIATCLSHEANTERVFSQAHDLSDPNMHASNLALATFIRFNLKN